MSEVGQGGNTRDFEQFWLEKGGIGSRERAKRLDGSILYARRAYVTRFRARASVSDAGLDGAASSARSPCRVCRTHTYIPIPVHSPESTSRPCLCAAVPPKGMCCPTTLSGSTSRARTAVVNCPRTPRRSSTATGTSTSCARCRSTSRYAYTGETRLGRALLRCSGCRVSAVSHRAAAANRRPRLQRALPMFCGNFQRDTICMTTTKVRNTTLGMTHTSMVRISCNASQSRTERPGQSRLEGYPTI